MDGGWMDEDEMMKMRILGKGETTRKRWLNNKTIRDDYVSIHVAHVTWEGCFSSVHPLLSPTHTTVDGEDEAICSSGPAVAPSQSNVKGMCYPRPLNATPLTP
jgi:hypothetical protein